MVNKFLALAFVMLLGLSVMVSADNGAVWTTTNSCGPSSPQDANHYMAGDVVFVQGDNFDAGTYDWDITGLPGGASADPNTVVANGTIAVNSTGAFCLEAYTVANDDLGEYKASVGNKHDNYRVEETPVVPEFGLIAGITTIAGALVALLIIRRN